MTTIDPRLRPGDVVDRRPDAGTEWLIQDQRLEGVTFRNLDGDAWAWLRFRHCEFVDCLFERCELNWHFGGLAGDQAAASTVTGSRFVRCDLRRFAVHYGGVHDSLFERCRWDANFVRTFDLVDNRFVGIVRRLVLCGEDASLGVDIPARSRPNLITGNDFSAADLRGCEVRDGVPVEAQRWPAGPHCGSIDRIPERLAALAGRIGGEPDAGRLRHWLSTYETYHGAGTRQTTVWARWDDPERKPVANRFVQLLAGVELPARP